jgi:DnaJ-class molecular chaperone
VFRPHRSHASRLALETLVPHERAFRRSLSDEVAIDFPSSRAATELFRRDHGETAGTERSTEVAITISQCQAGTGAMVPLEVRVPCTCSCCGGRGEVWSEHCGHCDGKGQELLTQRLTLAVPRGVTHGDRFSFTISPARGPRTRVDVRVAVMA